MEKNYRLTLIKRIGIFIVWVLYEMLCGGLYKFKSKFPFLPIYFRFLPVAEIV